MMLFMIPTQVLLLLNCTMVEHREQFLQVMCEEEVALISGGLLLRA